MTVSSPTGGMSTRSILLALVSVAVLSACGNSEPPALLASAAGMSSAVPRNDALANAVPAEICDLLANQPGSRIELDATTCPSCRADSLDSAIDGNFDTVATVNFAASTADVVGAFRLRVTAPPGATFPAGLAGAFKGRALGSDGTTSLAQISTTIRTYKSGLLSETSIPSAEGPNVGTFEEQFSLQSFAPTMDFDAMEMDYQWRGNDRAAAVRVSEFCNGSKLSVSLPDPPRTPSVSPRSVGPDPDGNTQVDLLLLYSPRFVRGMGSEAAARREAMRLTELANQFFANSKIAARYRVRDLQLYSGISETLTTSNALVLLQQDPRVASHRDAVGADLVALFVSQDLGFDLCGKATPFNGGVPSEKADGVDRNTDSFAIMAMGPGQFRKGCSATVFAHELGHVLGGGHEASSSPPGSYWKPYAHASTCGTKADGTMQTTIMHQDSDAESSYFSSPSLMRDGQPCGSEGTDGTETTQADNARSIREALPFVAGYR